MPPTPSPAPQLIQIVGGGDAAPWWGVPLIAGCFLLLGGWLSFLFTRANESRKFKHERNTAITQEVTDLIAEMFVLGNRFEMIGQRGRSGPQSEFAHLSVTQGPELMEEMARVFHRLRLGMPSGIQQLVSKYYAANVMLLMAPAGPEGQAKTLDAAAQTKAELINALRKLRDLEPLSVLDYDSSQERKETLIDGFIARTSADLETYFRETKEREERPSRSAP